MTLDLRIAWSFADWPDTPPRGGGTGTCSREIPARLFPEADLYFTRSISCRTRTAPSSAASVRIAVVPAARLPGSRKCFRRAVAAVHRARSNRTRRFQRGYDLVVPSSQRRGQGVCTARGQLHRLLPLYDPCATPGICVTRYLGAHGLAPGIRVAPSLRRMLDRLRDRDLRSSDRVTHFVATSQAHIRDRIARWLLRARRVRHVHPPVGCFDFFHARGRLRRRLSAAACYYASTASRWVPHKRMDLVAAAMVFRDHPSWRPPHGGRRPRRGLARAGPAGERRARRQKRQRGERLRRISSAWRALFARQADEDFGILPLEAQLAPRIAGAFALRPRRVSLRRSARRRRRECDGNVLFPCRRPRRLCRRAGARYSITRGCQVDRRLDDRANALRFWPIDSGGAACATIGDWPLQRLGRGGAAYSTPCMFPEAIGRRAAASSPIDGHPSAPAPCACSGPLPHATIVSGCPALGRPCADGRRGADRAPPTISTPGSPLSSAPLLSSSLERWRSQRCFRCSDLLIRSVGISMTEELRLRLVLAWGTTAALTGGTIFSGPRRGDAFSRVWVEPLASAQAASSRLATMRVSLRLTAARPARGAAQSAPHRDRRRGGTLGQHDRRAPARSPWRTSTSSRSTTTIRASSRHATSPGTRSRRAVGRVADDLQDARPSTRCGSRCRCAPSCESANSSSALQTEYRPGALRSRHLQLHAAPPSR